MSHANIQLHHESIADATARMHAASQEMISSLDAVISKLNAVQEKFKGDMATAWTNLQTVVNSQADTLNQEFVAGAHTLQHMHATLAEGDNSAGRQFH